MDRYGRPGSIPSRHPAGFTLIELVVVLAIVAVLTSLVAWSARPSPRQDLRHDATRLAIWLEASRAQARAAAWPAVVQVTSSGVAWVGATPEPLRQNRLTWQSPDTRPAQDNLQLTLGPEPFLPAQQLVLVSNLDASIQVKVWTNGSGPWRVEP